MIITEVLADTKRSFLYNRLMDLERLYDELRANSVAAARALLGWKLVHDTPTGRIAGYIVETEAYNQDDPASHTYLGMTRRNAAMFEEAGTLYVYFTYGMHYCVNIVSGPKGRGEAVLIRALEPVEGIELMQEKRNVTGNLNLTNGPAKLVQALGITREYTGSTLGGPLRLEKGFDPQTITQTSRVGISRAMEQPWRFYVSGNACVSKQ